MAFGQQGGPPATAKQVQALLALLHEAGHTDFRDARGPMGFTQRQAAGKFTRDEADAFIEQLETEAEQHGGSPPEAEKAPPQMSKIVPRVQATPRSKPIPKAAPKSRAPSSTPVDLEDVATEDLAAELQRRGWVVLEP